MTVSTQDPKPDLVLSIATLVAIIATLAVNVVSNFFPPQGMNIGEIANTVLGDVLVIPANYAFAIWGLIYLGLLAYGIYQLLLSRRQTPTIRRVDYLLIIACLAQIAWVYLFTNQLFWLSVVAILAILLPLIGAYLQLRNTHRASRQDKWLAQIPFSIYLAWISVATIVNIASALYVSGWDGAGINPPVWTVIVLIIGAIIAAVVAWQRADVAFTLVFIWAYVAIAIRQGDVLAIGITAIVSAVVLAGLLAFSYTKHQKLKHQREPVDEPALRS